MFRSYTWLICTLKAAAYLEAEPILWLPSKVWFQFLILRMQTIRDAQVTMSKAPAPNHGIITAIMMHLLRSTLVNPQRIPAFLNDNLRAMRYQEVIGCFGASFLHGLNVEASYLSDIDPNDNDNVQSFMGVVKKKTNKRHGLVQGSLRDNIVSVDFPLGPRPTWSEVVSFLSTSAEYFLRPQVFPTTSIPQQASQLFVDFTAHVWFFLADDCFTVSSLIVS